MILIKNSQFPSLITNLIFNSKGFPFSKVSKKVSNKTITNSLICQIPNSQQLNSSTQMMTKNKVIEKTQTNSYREKIDPCQTFQKIFQWKKHNLAPVDTIGFDRIIKSHPDVEIQKYQTLVALMISIQTTDQITCKVVKRLQQYGLTPQNIASTQQSKLVELIYESNFNKRKAKNIIQVSKNILESGLPKSQKQLLKLPGIGLKITMIYLRQAEGVQSGIGVDTHVHRISNKLGWVQTNNPNDTQKKLQQIFPKKYWDDLNVCLVGFGQILCNAKKQLCSKCPVNSQCPSSLTKSKQKSQQQ